ncbi:non-specific lipid transfer protein GPI-anchored 13-like [Andrographis paniculata]|uniref:non-specific lipid transfer protein GPI-anchored 13-like n=1 Tax=Andrographis paniculata TaxID=175694 RepID=UPI0021E7103A|nr:non-specific lipid transfer protein GPI-anchored 13-like [Andrographis paniculata]
MDTGMAITFIFFLAGAALLSSPSSAAAAGADEKDCAEQMTTLAACIPFVSGSAKQPTKECCDDTNKVKTAMPKCLCVLIKDSTDPSVGLPINTTLALQMPAACNIDARVSDCPSLLNLPADSPEAKIFKVASSGDSNAVSPATPKPATAAATGSESGKSASASAASGGRETAAVGGALVVTGLALAVAFV